MLTPMDIRNHELKTTMGGYNKKDTDDFIKSVYESYEAIYKDNHDLKEQVSSLSDGIQYYKQMETTLQKALVVAEKTASEIQDAARVQAEAAVKEAQTRAEAIESQTKTEIELMKSKAEHELNCIKEQIQNLTQSYQNYRLQFRELVKSQMAMLENEDFVIQDFEEEKICEEETYAEEADISYAAETDKEYSESEEVSREEMFEEQEQYDGQLYNEQVSYENDLEKETEDEDVEEKESSPFTFIDFD
ncbi:MAG: DivIVA domain-containing protein [Lachnospiraceae bacterium]|nr:DivIVA domain-containing protein [Lachnospiraceae bacterium]